MANPTAQNPTLQHWIVVHRDNTGKFAARALGLAEVAATADTRTEAIERVREMLAGLVESGQLVAVDVHENPLLQWSGRANPNDPHEQAYLEARQNDLENTLRELDQDTYRRFAHDAN